MHSLAGRAQWGLFEKRELREETARPSQGPYGGLSPETLDGPFRQAIVERPTEKPGEVPLLEHPSKQSNLVEVLREGFLILTPSSSRHARADRKRVDGPVGTNDVPNERRQGVGRGLQPAPLRIGRRATPLDAIRAAVALGEK